MFLKRYHNICCHIITCFYNGITIYIVIPHVFRTISQHLLSYHRYLKRYYNICHMSYHNICCHIPCFRTILKHLRSFTERYHNICCHITCFRTISHHISQHFVISHVLEWYHNICCHITCFSYDITTLVAISHVLELCHNICCHFTCF